MSKNGRDPRHPTPPGPLDLVEVAVAVQGGEPVKGRPAGLNLVGVRLFLRRSEAPELPLGTLVDLQLSGPSLAEPLAATSLVRHRAEAPGGWVYGFEFLEPGALRQRLPEELQRLFEENRSVRVEPDPARPVQVALATEHTTYPCAAHLNDLSRTGLSVLLSSLPQESWAVPERVSLSFRLPGKNEPLTFQGTVRYRLLLPEGVRLVIAFDPQHTRDFEEKQQRVIAYIVERQRSLVNQVLQLQS